MKGFSWMLKYLSPLGLKEFEPKCGRICDWTTTQCSCWSREMGSSSFFMSLWEHQPNVMANNHYRGGCCAFCGNIVCVRKAESLLITSFIVKFCCTSWPWNDSSPFCLWRWNDSSPYRMCKKSGESIDHLFHCEILLHILTMKWLISILFVWNWKNPIFTDEVAVDFLIFIGK